MEPPTIHPLQKHRYIWCQVRLWLPHGEASVKSKYLATMLTARPQIGEKGGK